ncbi:MAG: glycosyltransferase [Alphaproteobacteria bacterium]|nr:glycosyltransferase [Alphaproteobacteria bacterium]
MTAEKYETDITPQKYRALFVRQKSGLSGIDWLHRLEDEIVTMFSGDFKLTVIEDNFDYGEVCDKINPDLVIFDAPGGTRPVPLEISNRAARPDIPRIAFTNNQDPHDTSRVSLLKLMDDFRINNVFCLAGAAFMRQSPDLMGRIFPAPQYIDPEIFKDYGLEKIVPVSIFGWGAAPSFYHWRTSLVHEIYNYFPTLVYTHPSYTSTTEAHRFPISGAEYAKMINRSRFSLSDTTRLDYLVRKHLEIPACGTVLVTPATPDILYYGFRDLENCIMGSGIELYQKIAHVAASPDLYESIRVKGRDLVRNRFARDRWHWIRDWLDCWRLLKPGEMVQQRGVFGPFEAVRGGDDIPAVSDAEIKDSEFSAAMKAAWRNIIAGEDLQGTGLALNSMLEWVGHIAEPYMLLGVIALLHSEREKARDFFLRPYQIRCAREQNHTFFDPEELAWLAMTGVLMSDARLAGEARALSRGIPYLGLRRLNWLFDTQGRFDAPPASNVHSREDGDRLTTHWTGQLDLETWRFLMNRIMNANR